MTDVNRPDLPLDDLPSSSRYRRPRPLRLISWTGLLFGLLIGAAIGLYYTWNINPIVEVNTEPSQLEPQARRQYIAAITLSFAQDSDLERATARLLTVTGPRDPFQEVADIACEMAQTGYANSTSGLRALRSMTTFYQLQGRTSCADDLVAANVQPTRTVQIILPTPTPRPPATKTPTIAPTRPPTATPAPVFVPTADNVQQYSLINVGTFCEVDRSGIIEVYIQDFNGTGIPGQPVRVRWEGGEDTFYTGLKPERGPAYADFEMEEGVAYTIEMPDRSAPSSQQLVAVPCTTENGDRAITSYRATFRPNN